MVRRVANRQETQSKRISSQRPKDIEIFEVQSRDLLVKGFKPASVPWTKKDGTPCPHREEYPLPENYQWCGNWRVESRDALGGGGGQKDAEGWEYATSMSKFSPHRLPRTQTMKDHARRRKWIRQMIKMERAPKKSNEEKLAAIRSGLMMLGKAQDEVDKMGSKIGTPEDSMAMRDTIAEYLSKVKQAQATVQEHINSLASETSGSSGATAEDGMAASKLRREADRLIQRFQSVERNINSKLRGPVPTAVSDSSSSSKNPSRRKAGMREATKSGRIAASGSGGVFLDDASADGSDTGAWKSRLRQEQQMLGKLRTLDNRAVDEAIMEERNEAIKAVHSNVVVLNSLFKDMAQLVAEQQEGVDQVESNVQSAHEKTVQGVGELEQALEHQKKSCVIS